MKLTSYLCLAVALTCAATATAQTKKKSAKTKVVATVDTTVAPVRLMSDSEYSYAKGITHSEGIHFYLDNQYKLKDENLPQVAEGVRAYYSTSGDERNLLISKANGAFTGAMTATEMLPHFNRLLRYGADTAFIQHDAFLRGYAEQAKGEARYSFDQAREVLIRQDQYLRLQKAKTSYDEHLAYVATNSTYKPLTDGIYYRVLTKGKGALPKADSRVKVNYEGRLLDGKVFDSSYQRGEPIVFGLNQVIQGWGLALQKMPVGSTWEVVIPQELAYGERGAGADIPPYSSLVFKIELIGIEK